MDIVWRTQTQADFETKKTELFIEIVDIPMLTEYLSGTWFHDKEKFVAAWTNDCQHLRNTVTFAVEGAHAALKRYLQVSTCDLYAVRERIAHMLQHQVDEYYAAEATQKMSVPHNLRAVPMFKHLVGNVSRFALRLIEEQRGLALK